MKNCFEIYKTPIKYFTTFHLDNLHKEILE